MKVPAAAATAAMQVVKNEIRQTSGMNENASLVRAFDKLCEPIEKQFGAPWLTKMRGGDEIFCVNPDKRGTSEFQRLATADEMANGVFYKDVADYQAARAPI
jgi:hypothetical protein